MTKENEKGKNNVEKNDSEKSYSNPDSQGGATKTPRRHGKSSYRETRVKPEFEQKIISIRRVARVVAGGRRFSFSVALVAGDKKGRVGVGLGKASDTPLAIEKAFRDAKKNMIAVPLTKSSSISHESRGKHCASIVFLRPTLSEGVLAGSSVRDVIELSGVKNISAKVLSRSKNRLNNAKAAIHALQHLAHN